MLSVPIKIPAQASVSQRKENEDIFVSFHLLTAGSDETEKSLLAYATAEGNRADLMALFLRSGFNWTLFTLAA